MRVSYQLVVALLILCAVTLVQGQSSVQRNNRENLQAEQLKKLMSKVGIDVVEITATDNQPQMHREVKVRWTDPTSASPSAQSKPSISASQQKLPPTLSLVEDKKRSGTLARHRSLQLSPTHLFIAAVNETNQLRWWSIMADPRLIRAESQTSTGELRTQNFYQSNFTLTVAFPDDPEITNLHFYEPVWTGSEFELKLLAVVHVR